MTEDLQLINYLDVKRVNLNLKSSNKNDAIIELMQPIYKTGKVINQEAFLNDILLREEQGSTGIGDGIAIPHCRSEHVNDIIISIGRKPEGLDFDSIDDELVNIFFLLAIPKTKMQIYLKIISKLSRILNSLRFKEKFLSTESEISLLNIFQEAEENLQDD